MRYEEWSGARVAAALERLEDAGYPQSRMARLTGVSPSTINRWGRGIVRPGYDAVRRLAAGVWRLHPELARELVEASGYAWAEPPAGEVPPTAIERAFGDRTASFREAMASVFGDDAERKLRLVEEALSQLPEDDGAPNGQSARPGPR